MNPSGDYGKRELSPALRNWFTEIWVTSILDSSNFSIEITEQQVLKFLENLLIKK